jgi:hypothetical protein
MVPRSAYFVVLLAAACSSSSAPSTGSDVPPGGDGGVSLDDSGEATGTDAGTQGGGSGASSGGGASTDAAPEAAARAEAGAGLALDDDFESDAAGGPPSASLWSLVNLAGCGGGSYAIAVDASQAHSGTNSIKVSGGDSCGPLMVNTSAFAKIAGPDVYTRVYVRMPTATNLTHTPMIMLGLTATNTGSGSLDQASTLQLWPRTLGSANDLFWQTTDGNTLPQANEQAGATSAPFPADTWTCIETHTSSAGTGTLETWMNGTKVDGVSFAGGTTAVTPGVNDNWHSMPWAPKNLGLGWLVFSGPTLSVWFDDVAIGSARIGCN